MKEHINFLMKAHGFTKEEQEIFLSLPCAFLSMYSNIRLKTTRRKIDVFRDLKLLKIDYSIFLSLWSIFRSNYQISQFLAERNQFDFIEELESRWGFPFSECICQGFTFSEVKEDVKVSCFMLLFKMFYTKKNSKYDLCYQH